jgi:hypothetical protein
LEKVKLTAKDKEKIVQQLVGKNATTRRNKPALSHPALSPGEYVSPSARTFHPATSYARVVGQIGSTTFHPESQSPGQDVGLSVAVLIIVRFSLS